MIDRVRDCCSDTGQADLADAASADLIQFFVRVVEKMHFDRRSVSVHRNQVICQAAVDGAMFCGSYLCAPAAPCQRPSHLTLDLISARQSIDDLACIDDDHHAAEAQPGNFRLPSCRLRQKCEG